jgi:conflict system STAND superfamily ATPase
LTESSVIDISHEALLRQWTRLRGWLDAEAELQVEKRSVEQAAADWIEHRSAGFYQRVFGSRSFLQRGLRLKRALRVEPILSEDGKKFLNACRRSQRATQAAEGFLIVTALVAAWLSYRSFWLGQQEEARKKQAVLSNETATAVAAKNNALAQSTQLYDNAALVLKCAAQDGCSPEILTSLSKTLDPAGKTTPEAKRATVFLQIGDASQRPCAKLIQNGLLGSYQAPGIEGVSSVPAHTEVRYFHDGDRKAAEDLAEKIKRLANLPAVPVKPIKGYESKVPAQQFEVWFSSDFTCAAMDKLNFQSIVKDVQAVVSSSASGPILPKSREWAVIVSGNAPSSPALVAASQDGNGRVAALGHEWLLSDVGPPYRDNAVFISNLVGWLDVKKRRKVVYTTGHREWFLARGVNDLVGLLSQRQFTVRALPGALASPDLADSSVLIIGNAWGDFRNDEIMAVQSYVQGGGGLLLAGLGWSWLGYNPGKTMDDYPMTKMAKPYDIIWLDSVIAAPPVPGLAQSGLFTRLYPR